MSLTTAIKSFSNTKNSLTCFGGCNVFSLYFSVGKAEIHAYIYNGKGGIKDFSKGGEPKKGDFSFPHF